jgi:hypothetical protein
MIHILLNLFNKLFESDPNEHLRIEEDQQIALRAYTLKAMSKSLTQQGYKNKVKHNRLILVKQGLDELFKVEISNPAFAQEEGENFQASIDVTVRWGLSQHEIRESYFAVAPALIETVKIMVEKWAKTLLKTWLLLHNDSGQIAELDKQTWSKHNLYLLHQEAQTAQSARPDALVAHCRNILERLLDDNMPFHFLKIATQQQEREVRLQAWLDGYEFQELNQLSPALSDFAPTDYLEQYFLIIPKGETAKA